MDSNSYFPYPTSYVVRSYALYGSLLNGLILGVLFNLFVLIMNLLHADSWEHIISGLLALLYNKSWWDVLVVLFYLLVLSFIGFIPALLTGFSLAKLEVCNNAQGLRVAFFIGLAVSGCLCFLFTTRTEVLTILPDELSSISLTFVLGLTGGLSSAALGYKVLPSKAINK